MQLPNKTFAGQDELRKGVADTYKGLIRRGFISF